MQIVMIDNDATFLQSLRMQLEFEGHSVIAFSDPRHALFYFVRGNPADVLLIDYSMPEMNGDEVVERLRPELPAGCHIIMMSAHTDIASRIDAEELGIDTLLQKPISRSVLQHTLLQFSPITHKQGDLK